MSSPTRQPRPLRLVVLHAGVSEASTTQLLAERVATKVRDALVERDLAVDLIDVRLAHLASDIAQALVTGIRSARLDRQVELIAEADGLVAATPIYMAGASGLFKSFVDLLDDDLLVALPVVLAATTGSPRHALAVDDHLRPLFAYLRALTVPTSLSAAPNDWSDPAFTQRIERAATELAILMELGVRRRILGVNWSRHEHQFDSAAKRSLGIEDVELDTDLMRLAVGMSPRPHS